MRGAAVSSYFVNQDQALIKCMAYILMSNIENIHLDHNLYYWIIKMLHQTRIYIL